MTASSPGTCARGCIAYAEKAIREAGLRTTWKGPRRISRTRVHAWLDSVLDGPPAAELTELVSRLQPHTDSDALGQKLLR